MGQSPIGASVTDKPIGLEFHQGKICFTERYLSYSGLYTAKYRKKTQENSVLLCVRAPVGVVNITDREIAIGRGLCAVYPLAGISADFIFHWLIAFKDFLIEQATGTTFQAISIEIVKSLHIPLPPKNEQAKIIATIENVFDYLEEIINSLN
jgi:type I restriction enzyme S subunit